MTFKEWALREFHRLSIGRWIAILFIIAAIFAAVDSWG